MEKKSAEASVTVAEIPLETTKHRSGFFSRRRNIVLLAISGTILLILVVLTPVLKLVYFKDRSEDVQAQLQSDVSTYAVVKSNFPDPCLIRADGGYYAFATRPLANTSLHIQVASAPKSISQWTLHEGYDALPSLPPWVKQFGDPGVWSPQVTQRRDGTFVMVYSALHKDYPRKHCLGMATSRTVLGPYDPGNSTEPLLCHLSVGGIIDPTFLDDPLSNQTYLVYKNDGNSMGSGGACANSKWPNTPTTFEHSMLTQPGWTTLASSTNSHIPLSNQTAAVNTVNESSIFMHNTQDDGPNIESPQAWYQEYPATGKKTEPRRAYHLLYNTGCFADKTYRIEHLVCWLNNTQTTFVDCDWQSLKNTSTSLLLQTGSYPQPDGNPTATLLAPGGPGVDQDGKYMAFHADIVPSWFDEVGMHQPGSRNMSQSQVGRNYTRQRALFIAELESDSASTADGQGFKIGRFVRPSTS